MHIGEKLLLHNDNSRGSLGSFAGRVNVILSMVSQAVIKQVRALQRKKNRTATKQFVVEGHRGIQDIMDTGMVPGLFLTTNPAQAPENIPVERVHEITQRELQAISSLTTAPGTLAVFPQPVWDEVSSDGLSILLDEVRDPGNLGTIIRLAGWFGVDAIYCSTGTIDVYNAKVVQATMAAIVRVPVIYLEADAVTELVQSRSSIATTMDGHSVYEFTWPQSGLLIMGNESHGMHPDLIAASRHNISIPQFAKTNAVESLNVATATGILLNEWRRRG